MKLSILLASMNPTLGAQEFVFVSLPTESYGARSDLAPIAAFVENEGLTLVVPRDRAEAAGLTFAGSFRMITLNVHSSLTDVGLTAAVTECLATHGISANVIAAFHHDHLFVPADRAEEAQRLLEELASRTRRI